jgi:hypothetical protein
MCIYCINLYKKQSSVDSRPCVSSRNGNLGRISIETVYILPMDIMNSLVRQLLARPSRISIVSFRVSHYSSPSVFDVFRLTNTTRYFSLAQTSKMTIYPHNQTNHCPDVRMKYVMTTNQPMGGVNPVEQSNTSRYGERSEESVVENNRRRQKVA